PPALGAAIESPLRADGWAVVRALVRRERRVHALDPGIDDFRGARGGGHHRDAGCAASRVAVLPRDRTRGAAKRTCEGLARHASRCTLVAIWPAPASLPYGSSSPGWCFQVL